MPVFTALAGLLALTLLVHSAGFAVEPDPRYWRLAEIEAQFAIWADEYPAIFHATVLGQSGQGVDIPAVRISDNAGVAEAEPRLLFHGAQHANECNGTTAIMATIATLLAGYGGDPDITARVDGLEQWFIPIVNVDGHLYVFGDTPSWQNWRKTLRDNNDNGIIDFPADGVDMNRNWDWYWSDYSESEPSSQKYKGPRIWSEPEVVLLRDFVLNERPVLVVDYHSPVTIGWSNYIFWPWQSTHGGGQSPDAPVARDIAMQWADATLTETGQSYSTIWAYDTLPKEQCWVYGRTGIITYVMEIADHCWWSGATIDTIGSRVARGSVLLQDRVLTGPGITGMVTDAMTGAALVAEVQLAEMHSADVGPRLSESRFGQYHRLTQLGTYTVTVSLRGYTTQTRTVTVDAADWFKLDFALQPDLSGVAGPEGVESWLQVSNPVQGGRLVRCRMPAGTNSGQVDLFDLRGRWLAELGSRLAAEQVHELTFPRGLPAGVYLIRARAGDQQQVRRVVLVR